MALLIQEIVSRPPKCIGPFIAANTTEVDNSNFVSFNLVCSCGSEEFSVAATRIAETTGLFEKNTTYTYLAPIVVTCSACGQTAKIFDPRIHGWDGEIDCSASQVGNEEPKHCFADPTQIRVTVSYQGIENYEDLKADGVQNLEDFFDTFSLSTRTNQGGDWIELVNYECA